MSGDALTLVPLSGTPADAALCSGVHGLAFARPWDAGAFAGLLVLPTTQAAVAVRGDADPVGLVVVQVAGGEAEILTIGVVPAARRGGVAARLLDWAIDMARAAGAERLFLEVAADNAPARALYAAAALVEVAVRRGYYKGGGDAVVMALDLRSCE